MPRNPYASLTRRRLLEAGALLLASRAAGARQASQGSAIQAAPIAIPKTAVLPAIAPVYMWEGIPTIVGTIARKQPSQRFVLASGCNACTVTDAVYTGFLLHALGSRVRVDVFDTRGEADEVVLPSVVFGSLALADMKAVIFEPFKSISSSGRTDAPACWLGTPFISAFSLTLDMKAGIVLLDRPAQQTKPRPDEVSVPAQVRDGRMVVAADVPHGKPAMLLVDTASPGTVLPASAMPKGKPPAATAVTVRLNGRSVGGAVMTLPEFGVAKARLPGFRALVLAPGTATPFRGADGVLGMDFLSSFRVRFDFNHRRLLLGPAGSTLSGSPAPPG